jgi:hypothetical protein
MNKPESTDKLGFFWRECLVQHVGMVYSVAPVSADTQNSGGSMVEHPGLSKLAKSDMVIFPAVDRPSRDMTDFVAFAHDMRRAERVARGC